MGHSLTDKRSPLAKFAVQLVAQRKMNHARKLGGAVNGLEGTVWSGDVAREHAVASRIEIGIIWANGPRRFAAYTRRTPVNTNPNMAVAQRQSVSARQVSGYGRTVLNYLRAACRSRPCRVMAKPLLWVTGEMRGKGRLGRMVKNPSAAGQSRPEELESLVRSLRSQIHSGEFVPGQRLIEADLVADSGMSRGRVRDALRVLEGDGLVQIDRNRGASVRRISRKEVIDTLELMRAISALMTEKAIRRSDDPEARAALLGALDQARIFRDKLSDFQQSRQFMDQNALFWDVFSALSDNPVLMDTRMRLETTLFRLALAGAKITSAKDQWVNRHEDILEAVLAGERDRALKLVEESVLDVEKAMLALPDSAFAR